MELQTRTRFSSTLLKPSKMRFVALLSLLLVYGSGQCLCQFNDAPGCSTGHIRSCGMDFIPYYNTTHLAEDIEGYAKQCNLYISQVVCAENFTLRCLQGFSRAVALLGLRAALADYEESCNHTSANYKVYINNIACINKAGPRLHRCINDAFASFETAVEKAPSKQKINYACCYYYDLLDCSAEALKSECGRQDVIKFFTQIMDHVFGDLLQLACGPYRHGSQACKTIRPLQKIDSSALGAINIVEPLADIVRSLG
ncbi:uncharacterized protein LOC135398245 [Ornithodoros turicata]|uniref:uncharacterized protein LOC135398245 n=1 Tax=Ornithodoros turicata TaxID=34597 RepID=UPI00313A246C